MAPLRWLYFSALKVTRLDTTLRILQMGKGQTLQVSTLELSLQKWNPMC